MKDEATFDKCWAIIELFGHQQIAGQITEQVIAGGPFLRVDVPEIDGKGGFTRFYGAAAVYSITPVAEEVARLAVRRIATPPVTVWIPELRLTAPQVKDDPDHPYEEDEIEF